jgi:ABC-2 type transport system permease protein
MLRDLWTIIQKEWHEYFSQRGSLRSSLIMLALVIGVFGIYAPATGGTGWANSPFTPLSLSWIAFLAVSGVIADTFAGERERHTLETLLASRLPDTAIVLGKTIAAVIYGWATVLLTAAIGLLVANVASSHTGVVFFPQSSTISLLGLSGCIAILAALIGTLLSMEMAAVKPAQQILSLGSILLLVPLFLFNQLPRDTQQQFLTTLLNVNSSTPLFLEVIGVFLLIDALLLLVVLLRFRRTHLILIK